MPPVAERQTTPDFPTQLRKRLTRGRLVGVDNSVWLYRAVPMSPVVDARDTPSLLEALRPISEAIDELASATITRTARRSLNKSSYRRVHMLLVDIPRSFLPPPEVPNAAKLRADYASVPVRKRVLLFGVRLTDKLGGDSGLSEAISSVVETLMVGGAPISDYDPDVEAVDAICARVGMRVPTDEEVRIANAWWNYGWTPEVVDLEHIDHLHVFATPDSARAAAAIGEADCERFEHMADHSSFAFGAVEDFLLPFYDVEESDPSAAWCANLVALGATVVSIRGLCEPPQVTRGELRRHRKKFIDDLNERANSRHGALSRSEQDEMVADLTDMEALYASGGPSTLIDTSVVVAFSGMGERGYDLSEVGAAAGVRLAPMTRRQRAAWTETMLCSPVLASPYLHDLPSHMVAASGMTSLSVVGDKPPGAVIGFTENDRQPAWISPVAASNSDALPIFLAAGATGSGKMVSLRTAIPTPFGKTLMGNIRVGDTIFGRDGNPCTVRFLSEINNTPDLYRVTFDDGQEVLADAEHQWVVSTFRDRNWTRKDKHKAAIARWDEAQEVIDQLEAMSSRIPADEESTITELHELVHRDVPGIPWATPAGVLESLSFVECPSRPRSGGGVAYPTALAVKALAVRMRQMFPLRPEGTVLERVVTTGEMLAGGLRTGDGDPRFAVRVAAAVDLPDAELPVGAYEAGRQAAASGRSIDTVYLRASVTQRRAVLQGIVDASDAASDAGYRLVTLPDGDLAAEVAELVRSLGLKATLSGTGGSWDVRWSARNEEPDDEWLYVTDITPVPVEPARCIQVDSPDGTYLVEGFVPTHNTMVMLHLATQFSEIPTAKGERTPVVILDPKAGSDLSPAVETVGGQVSSLDDLTTGDGIYDPLRFSTNRNGAIDLATSLLLQINPWGSHAADWETPLTQSIAHGVEHGATCIGEALSMALRNGVAPKEMVERVFALSSSPLFRACVGIKPGTAGLRLAEGITYIRVGGAYLDLPAPGAPATTQPQRISSALVRMMVFGSAMALSGRQGVIMLDEAWVFIGAGRSEMERLGRLARSQQVLPMLFTQRVTDALDAGLTGAISRGMVMSLNDESEARAALELFGLEATPTRVARITGRDTVGGTDGEVAPNWASFKALRDWKTGRVLRGSIGIYSDLYGRAVPVEVVIPPSLFLAASTNPEDIRRREAEKAAILEAKGR